MKEDIAYNPLGITAKPAVPYIDHELCVRCGDCVKVCPTHAIIRVQSTTCARCIKYCLSMDVDCRMDSMLIKPDICDNCGKCITVCQYKAIRQPQQQLNSQRNDTKPKNQSV